MIIVFHRNYAGKISIRFSSNGVNKIPLNPEYKPWAYIHFLSTFEGLIFEGHIFGGHIFGGHIFGGHFVIVAS